MSTLEGFAYVVCLTGIVWFGFCVYICWNALPAATRWVIAHKAVIRPYVLTVSQLAAILWRKGRTQLSAKMHLHVANVLGAEYLKLWEVNMRS